MYANLFITKGMQIGISPPKYSSQTFSSVLKKKKKDNIEIIQNKTLTKNPKEDGVCITVIL